MALFDGFFDSYYDQETDAYDREYGSDEFTEYFDQMIGSGVCIHKSADSFKVRLENGNAVISPGYLFIQGYWLKNDEDYTVELSGNSPLAVAAHLDLGKRLIDVVTRPIAESYPDCLVLALFNGGSLEDTRYRTDICGVIDASAALSEKIEYAINYIDNEAEARLKQIEADMLVQEKKIDKKIADVEAEAVKMEPLPVGTIKFSANPNVGEKWLKCDGHFISYDEYPELVSELRGLTDGLYDKKLLSTYVPSGEITLGSFFEGYFWTICISEKKIYRTSLEDGSTKEITAVFPANSHVSSFQTFSVVKVGSQNNMYLLDIRSCLVDVFEVEGTGDDPTGSKLELEYFCCNNFSVDQNTVTFVKKTITGNPPETFRAYSAGYQIPTRSFDYRPVVVYNSVPYAALEIGMWSSNYIPRTNALTRGTRLNRSIVIADLSGNGEFVLHEIDVKYWDGSVGQETINYLYNGPNSSLLDATPFDPDKGGLMIASDVFYAVKGREKQRLGSLSNGWSGTVFQNSVYCPIISDDYLVMTIQNNCTQVVRRYNMDFVYTEFSGGWGAEFYPLRAAKDKIYLPDCNLYAKLAHSGIVFMKKPDDPAHNIFFNTVDIFGDISNDGPSQTVFFDYSKTDRKLYIIWQNKGYRFNIATIKVPAGFDPFNGANLPEMSTSGIPAYIKAKEG